MGGKKVGIEKKSVKRSNSQPPIKTLRVGTSAVKPKKTPHRTVISPEGTQRAAGMLWIITVIEPFTIRFGGPTGGGGTIGGCAIPPVITPEQTTAHPTCAAGKNSIITGPVTPGGHGPLGGRPITPLGTSMSCVTGSPFLAAGNIVFTPRNYRTTTWGTFPYTWTPASISGRCGTRSLRVPQADVWPARKRCPGRAPSPRP